MEFGIYTFAEVGPQPGDRAERASRRLCDLIEEIELADQVGLDLFGVGEHHRPDYAVSSPAVVLAAAAMKTKKIRLSSAVSVLSSDDPVRVYQDFATLDLLSQGRAEVMAGRGSFIESFPLFGYDLHDYDSLFAEKLDLLLAIRGNENLHWTGKHRAALNGEGVYPRALQKPLPVWVAVGGTPQSVVRAAERGLPMALAIIGGTPDRFVPFINLYRQTAAKSPETAATAKVSINSHGFIADTSQEAAETAFPPYMEVMSRIGRERGWGPATRHQFDAEISPRGAVLVGSPQQVIDKLLYEHELFAYDRFLIQFTVGPTPHDKVMRCIELFGTRVVPEVRKALAPKAAAATPA